MITNGDIFIGQPDKLVFTNVFAYAFLNRICPSVNVKNIFNILSVIIVMSLLIIALNIFIHCQSHRYFLQNNIRR